MSIGYLKIKIGVEEGGELLYLKDIHLSGETISYDTTADEEEADIIDDTAATSILVALKHSEPDKAFLVYEVR